MTQRPFPARHHHEQKKERRTEHGAAHKDGTGHKRQKQPLTVKKRRHPRYACHTLLPADVTDATPHRTGAMFSKSEP